jgi:hypothetical protein
MTIVVVGFVAVAVGTIDTVEIVMFFAVAMMTYTELPLLSFRRRKESLLVSSLRRREYRGVFLGVGLFQRRKLVFVALAAAPPYASRLFTLESTARDSGPSSPVTASVYREVSVFFPHTHDLLAPRHGRSVFFVFLSLTSSSSSYRQRAHRQAARQTRCLVCPAAFFKLNVHHHNLDISNEYVKLIVI